MEALLLLVKRVYFFMTHPVYDAKKLLSDSQQLLKVLHCDEFRAIMALFTTADDDLLLL